MTAAGSYSAPPPPPDTQGKPPIRILTAGDGDWASQRAELVAALAAGSLVVLPTETVYGLAGAGAGGLERLRSARLKLNPAATAGPATWHASSVEGIERLTGVGAPLHRRLVHRLLPGPVTFMFPMTDALAAALGSVGLSRGAADDGQHLYIRVPDQSLTRQVLQAVGDIGVLAEGIPQAGGSVARDWQQAEAALRERHIEVAAILNAGPSTLGRPSSVIRLITGGGWELVRAGVYNREYIERIIQRRVLFVCTGNTCRSPMAQAIASGLLQERAPLVPTVALSAGLSAGDGASATREGVDAVRELGYRPPSSGSKGLTRQMIAEADVIYAMTQAHVNGVLRLDSEAGGKVRLLDPAGDIADPIGGPAALYATLAERMRELIATRLKELDE